MKVILRERKGYNDYQGLQFASVERTTNKMMFDTPQKCKELFADLYFHPNYKHLREGRRFRFLILLTMSPKPFNAEATQNFLNQVEAEMGFGKSKVWEVQTTRENTRALLIDSSIRWLKSSPLFHLLLLLARNGSNHDPKKDYKSTLAKFRRGGKPLQEVDVPQFQIIRDSLPHVINRKGNLEAFGYNHLGNLVNIGSNIQKGVGICQWTAQIRERGII